MKQANKPGAEGRSCLKMSTNSQQNFHTSILKTIQKQEIWANAHETCESL